MATDSVCGMTVEEDKATIISEHEGRTYYFCAPGCKREFDEHPERYIGRTGGGEESK